MEMLPAFLAPFPYVLWLTGTVLFALSLFPQLEIFRVTSLVVGVLGTVLAYLALKLHWTDAQISAVRLLDFRTAFQFFVVAWGSALVIHLVRHRFFSARMIPGWTLGLFLIGFLLGSAYLVRAVRGSPGTLRAALPVIETPAQVR